MTNASILPIGDDKIARIQYRLDVMYGESKVSYLSGSRKYRCEACRFVGKCKNMWHTRSFPCRCVNPPYIKMCGDNCYIEYDQVEECADSVFEKRLLAELPALSNKSRFIDRYDTVEVAPMFDLFSSRSFNVPAFIGYSAIVDWLAIDIDNTSNTHLRYVHNAYLKLCKMFPNRRVYFYIFSYSLPAKRTMVNGKYIKYIQQDKIMRLSPKNGEKFAKYVDFNNAVVRRFGLDRQLLLKKFQPKQPTAEQLEAIKQKEARKLARVEKRKQLENESANKREYRKSARLQKLKVSRIIALGKSVNKERREARLLAEKEDRRNAKILPTVIDRFTAEHSFDRFKLAKERYLKQIKAKKNGSLNK